MLLTLPLFTVVSFLFFRVFLGFLSFISIPRSTLSSLWRLLLLSNTLSHCCLACIWNIMRRISGSLPPLGEGVRALKGVKREMWKRGGVLMLQQFKEDWSEALIQFSIAYFISLSYEGNYWPSSLYQKSTHIIQRYALEILTRRFFVFPFIGSTSFSDFVGFFE